jgi:hypothetical protein
MASAASHSSKSKSLKKQTGVLGRSAATGRFVLNPATSKGATITMREANSAVKSLNNKKK